MRIAVPLFGSRISPRFDCAQALLVVDIDAGVGERRQTLDTSAWAPLERPARLAGQGINVLICGGIDRSSFDQLSAIGVTVYSWVTGEAEDALQAFLEGRLAPGTMMGGGGRCCGRWRFRGRGAPGEWLPAENSAQAHEEMKQMPRGDGTGPAGQGPGTGRGMGTCGQGGKNRPGQGQGQGRQVPGQGLGGGMGKGRGGGRGSGRGQGGGGGGGGRGGRGQGGRGA